MGGGVVCRCEAAVLTNQLADQWDVVNQQSDPYGLTLLWMAGGRGVCLCLCACLPIYMPMYTEKRLRNHTSIKPLHSIHALVY